MRPVGPQSSVAEPCNTKPSTVVGNTASHEAALRNHLASFKLNDEQRELHELAGQQEWHVIRTRATILQGYRTPGAGFTLGTIRDHLHFLYLTHSLRQSRDELSHMAIVDRSSRLVKPALRDIYLPGTSSPYEPESLFASQGAAPGFSALYVHPALLENVPTSPEPGHPTWRSWLCDFLGVKASLPLTTAQDVLSPEITYVATHRPDAFLQVLRRLWSGRCAEANAPVLRAQIRLLPVLCCHGGVRSLCETYLPLQSLRSHCSRLMGSDRHFNFLQLPEELGDEGSESEWAWLKTEFGVSYHDDVGFLLDILARFQELCAGTPSLDVCRILIPLYCEIEAACLKSPEPLTIRDIVRTYIEDIRGVLAADTMTGQIAWAHPKECSWGTPAHRDGIQRTDLLPLHRDTLRASSVEMMALESFFQRTLGIACTGDDEMEL